MLGSETPRLGGVSAFCWCDVAQYENSWGRAEGWAYYTPHAVILPITLTHPPPPSPTFPYLFYYVFVLYFAKSLPFLFFKSWRKKRKSSILKNDLVFLSRISEVLFSTAESILNQSISFERKKKFISCIYLFLEATLPLPTHVFKPCLEKKMATVCYFF